MMRWMGRLEGTMAMRVDVKAILIGMLVLLLTGCSDMRGQAAYMHDREITGPYYSWIKLDDHRSLQLARIMKRDGAVLS